jgi:hypothetical protein
VSGQIPLNHLARHLIDREADIVVGDSENAMPDHQHAAAVVPIDNPIPKPAAPLQIVRPKGVGALDTDQLAAEIPVCLNLKYDPTRTTEWLQRVLAEARAQRSAMDLDGVVQS